MSNKAVYYKDDGEPCQLCKERSGFCHIHADRTSESSKRELEDTSPNEAVESDDSGFSAADNPNHCPECENLIRVHSAALTKQRHNPNRVNVNLVLRCSCEEAEIPNGFRAVEASYLPDKWL